MSDPKPRPIDERIADVERRLEFRRGRIEYDVREIKDRLSRQSRWLPLGAAAGAIVVGFAIARARSRPEAARTLYAPGRVYEARKAGMAASVLGLAGSIARIALSPQGRLLWKAFRRGIERGRAYGGASRFRDAGG